jgi:4-hydroxythreonine-4-phosphate dehydrogenase
MKTQKIRIGITQGDINGIGYEVILKTLLDNRILEICTPVVYGSPKVAAYHRKTLNISDFSLNIIKSPEEANPKRANIINCLSDDIRVELGKSTAVAGEASYLSLKKAVEDAKNGKLDALVTAPINKYNIQSDNFKFPGHTEFLKDYFNVNDVLMLMTSDFLKVGLFTVHVPLKDVFPLISEESISQKIRLMNRSLSEDFRIRKPKIAVLGLNPHAGEDGMLGKEENEIIKPAIENLKKEELLIFGPYAADGFFGSGNYMKFDGIFALYHDQGLIPFKSLVRNEGVNYTAGLPVIRTSPAHGTAFELAGKNMASHDSFRKAIYTACDIYQNRLFHADITNNPLSPVDLKELE